MQTLGTPLALNYNFMILVSFNLRTKVEVAKTGYTTRPQ